MSRENETQLKNEYELSVLIRKKLGMTPQALRSRLLTINKKFKSYKRKFRLGIIAFLAGLEELSDFFSTEDLDSIREKSLELKGQIKKDASKKKELLPLDKKRTPYDFRYSEFKIHPVLLKKISGIAAQKTDAIQMNVSKALEIYIKEKLSLDKSLTGQAVVSEMTKKGVFITGDKGEEEGLPMLFRGYFLWFRNNSHHNWLPKETKNKSLEIIMLTNHLLDLFDDLVKKNLKI